MTDDITAIETAQENNERLGDLCEMLNEVRNKGLIYWEPNTDRGADAQRDMIGRIDAFLTPEGDGTHDPIARANNLLREARDQGLIYWEPNTTRGVIAQRDMVARIDRMIGIARFSPETDEDAAPAGPGM
ncbi:hypothetical protein [Salipiger mucosus]|uniref:Uncharacterized protein n=1 Tax=Salipiger mucosus DSM 16094 TaxID=1123237 RepID=S9SEQ2_9RHOB|nr:hypothetical protein [Salipiger mucosus]EPX84759.1 hypothetical protein Salmuc_01332 [Salipiger mucosus DSM 16094]